MFTAWQRGWLCVPAKTPGYPSPGQPPPRGPQPTQGHGRLLVHQQPVLWPLARLLVPDSGLPFVSGPWFSSGLCRIPKTLGLDRFCRNLPLAAVLTWICRESPVTTWTLGLPLHPVSPACQMPQLPILRYTMKVSTLLLLK